MPRWTPYAAGTSRVIYIAIIAAITMAVYGAERPSFAACFESNIGCTHDHVMTEESLSSLSCDALWTVRNTIFADNGYCFKTPRAREAFSNEGCVEDDQSRLALNRFERANVSRIVKMEKSKGCR